MSNGLTFFGIAASLLQIRMDSCATWQPPGGAVSPAPAPQTDRHQWNFLRKWLTDLQSASASVFKVRSMTSELHDVKYHEQALKAAVVTQ